METNCNNDFNLHTKYDVFQDSVGRAEKYVQSELERFQETLHRCVLSCQVYLLTTYYIQTTVGGLDFFLRLRNILTDATEHDGN